MCRVNNILIAIAVAALFATTAIGATSTLWFTLDETTGTTAADSSGNANNGTYTGGPTLGAAAPNNLAAYFPSDGKCVIAPASGTLNALGVSNADFSVAFWVKPAAATGGWRPLLHKGTTDNERGPGIWLNPGSNRVHFRVSTTANWNEGTDSAADLPTGAWSHVACVKAGNKWRCYVNGVLDTEFTLSADTTGNNGPLYVGDDPWYGGSNVYMDDVRLYTGALTDTEVQYLYGLVGYWKFAEGSGTTAADSSALANTVTLSGGAAWETSCAGKNALQTNGTGGIAQTNSSFTPPSVGTVAFWMRGAGPSRRAAAASWGSAAIGKSARNRVVLFRSTWAARHTLATNHFRHSIRSIQTAGGTTLRPCLTTLTTPTVFISTASYEPAGLVRSTWFLRPLAFSPLAPAPAPLSIGTAHCAMFASIRENWARRKSAHFTD